MYYNNYMIEKPSEPSGELYQEKLFNVSSTVNIGNDTNLLMGHDMMGDFYIRAGLNKRAPLLSVYHSNEPTLLAHAGLQLSQHNGDINIIDLAESILKKEKTWPVSQPHYVTWQQADQESADRSYDKVYKSLAWLARDASLSLPDGIMFHEDRLLQATIHHTENGIRISDENWDDEFSLSGPDIKRHFVVATIDNEHLPDFAAALVATSRTDYGRVKHSDMIDTLLYNLGL